MMRSLQDWVRGVTAVRHLMLRSLMLLSVVAAPVSAPAVLTSALSDAACETACPCDAETPAINLALEYGDAASDGASADNGDQHSDAIAQTACADDCGQCSCCVSAFLALTPDPGLLPLVHPLADARIAGHDGPASGVHAGVFRPPQRPPV